MQRLEQLLRWSGAKADALPSAEAWPFDTTGAPRISKLLIVRSTASNGTLATTFERTLAPAYPGDPWQALAALRGDSPWPGSAMLWAVQVTGSRFELRAAIRSRNRP